MINIKGRKNLSPLEVEWFQKYSSSLAELMGSMGGSALDQSSASGGGGGVGAGRGLDLSAHTVPPKSVFLQCRCVCECGQVECADGSLVLLTRGSEHLLERADCEPLIRAGYLVQIGD